MRFNDFFKMGMDMEQVIEGIKEVIERRTGEFSLLDRVAIHNELMAYLEEENRVLLLEEYGLADEDE